MKTTIISVILTLMSTAAFATCDASGACTDASGAPVVDASGAEVSAPINISDQ